MARKPINALTLYQEIGKNTKPALLPEQLMHILQKTPAQHIYKRPGKGGGEWEYVTGVYIKKVLNYVFAWNWDFEVKSKEEKYGQVIVTGRLTVRTKNGTIFKEQVGRADIKMRKGTQTPMDYGNDEKSAITDALKKCASEFGIASDIYGKNEFKEIKYILDEPVVKPVKEIVSGLKSSIDIVAARAAIKVEKKV